MSRILSYGQFKANTPPIPYHQLKLPGMEGIANHSQATIPHRSYLRFGQWPADEQSRNNVTGEKEFGVSTYELHPHTNQPLDPDPDLVSEGAEWALDGMRNRVRDFHQGRHPGFVVRGRHVSQGHDGEPLLSGVEHVEDWRG